MHDQETSATSASKRDPWNKGRLTGAKPPLHPRHALAPKPDEEHAPSGSPGSIADRNQAKEREQPGQKGNTLPTK